MTGGSELLTDESLVEGPVRYGAYELLGVLGRGATAKVYLARPIDPDRGIPTPVVIKRLHPELADQLAVLRRFKDEAELAVAISSPHVVRVYDVGVAGGTWYIAMEHISGWRLSEVVDELVARMPQEIATALVLGALDGVAAIHEATDASGIAMEIVHRDLSPNNLMIADDGALKIIDLGLGKWSGRGWQTQAGKVAGTRGYMSPEQMVGGTMDRRSDLYVLGVLLYELLAGEPFFENRASFGALAIEARVKRPPRISEKRRDISAALETVVARAVAFEPAERFQSAREFREALLTAFPRAGDSRAVEKYVAELLGERVAARRVEIARMLRAPRNESEPEPGRTEKTVVLARRPGVRPATDEEATVVARAAAGPISPPAEDALIQNVVVEHVPRPPQPAPRTESSFGATVLRVLHLRPEIVRTRVTELSGPPKRRAPLAMLAAVGIAGALSAAIVLAWVDRRLTAPRSEGTMPVVVPPVVPVPVPVPVPAAKVEARAREVEPERVEPAIAEPVAAPEPAVPVKRKARTAAIDVQPADPPPAKPEAVSEEELMRKIAQLASELRKSRPERQAEIDRIVSDASLAHGDEKGLARALEALRKLEPR